MKRRAGEGRRGGQERGDPSPRGARTRSQPRGECSPRAGGCITLRGPRGGQRKGPRGGWVGGGPGVQRAAGVVPFCAPAEAAVIFVCVLFELIGSPGLPGVVARGPGPGNLTRVVPYRRALARFRKVRVREGVAASASQVWLRRAEAKRFHPRQWKQPLLVWRPA